MEVEQRSFGGVISQLFNVILGCFDRFKGHPKSSQLAHDFDPQEVRVAEKVPATSRGPLVINEPMFDPMAQHPRGYLLAGGSVSRGVKLRLEFVGALTKSS